MVSHGTTVDFSASGWKSVKQSPSAYEAGSASRGRGSGVAGGVAVVSRTPRAAPSEVSGPPLEFSHRPSQTSDPMTASRTTAKNAFQSVRRCPCFRASSGSGAAVAPPWPSVRAGGSAGGTLYSAAGTRGRPAVGGELGLGGTSWWFTECILLRFVRSGSRFRQPVPAVASSTLPKK
ncbi:conserved hypothetical protein [Arthrobacter sp. 9AX]|nr:conserved hypothetical protein [Arthrobacter sp. 9AX]